MEEVKEKSFGEKLKKIEDAVDTMDNREVEVVKPEDKKEKAGSNVSRKGLLSSVVLLVVFSVVLATAGYMVFLSNPSETEVSVDSPLLSLETRSNGSSSWSLHEGEPLSLGSVYGTETVSWDFRVTKNAMDNSYYSDKDHYGTGFDGGQIVGEFQAVLSDTDGVVSLDELDSIVVEMSAPSSAVETLVWSNDGDSGNDDFVPVDVVDGGVRVVYPTVILHDQWGYQGSISLIFDEYAVGGYSIVMQVI